MARTISHSFAALTRDIFGTLRIYDGDGEDDACQKNLFLFYFEISHLFGTIQCVCRHQNLLLPNVLRMRSVSNRINEKLAVVAQVLQATQNLVISRCCFAEDGKEMYKDL